MLRKIEEESLQTWNSKIQKLSENADWLTQLQKDTILREIYLNPQTRNLSKTDQVKLSLVLFCIPFAEYQIKIQGKWLTKFIKDSALLRPLIPYICSTLGTWSLHLLHAEKFDLTRREFRKILLDDSRGIHFVISFVMNYIGLHKPLEHIFAEYNYREMSTTVVALQRLLNLFLSIHDHHPIDEDGILEHQTKKAIDFCCSSLNIGFTLDLEKGEENISSLIEILSNKTLIRVRPFIPKIRYKRGITYAKKILKSSIKQPIKMKKLLNLFQNHIDISSYTQFALEACNKLEQENPFSF